ncbi:MAG: hypothetical protein JNM56_13195 [Planctomycetia bacterium]|nr:hypothetical protein [Planctomycetia bacterium]
MNLVWITVGGVVAHVLSVALAQYARWLLGKVMQGEVHFGFGEDLRLFIRSLLRGLAERLCDRRAGHHSEEYEVELPPGYFSAR